MYVSTYIELFFTNLSLSLCVLPISLSLSIYIYIHTYARSTYIRFNSFGLFWFRLYV